MLDHRLGILKLSYGIFVKFQNNSLCPLFGHAGAGSVSHHHLVVSCFRQEEVLQRPIVYEGNTVPIPRVKVPQRFRGSTDERIDK